MVFKKKKNLIGLEKCILLKLKTQPALQKAASLIQLWLQISLNDISADYFLK